jgi:hypothetical protein
MQIEKKYVVYELNRVMGSEQHLALEKIDFDGFLSNSFNTEDEAIEALIKDGRTYQDYLILRKVNIRS